jgi:DnaJ domain
MTTQESPKHQSCEGILSLHLPEAQKDGHGGRPVKQVVPKHMPPSYSIMLAENLYQVLGVPETATAKEIKAAYRKKAVKLHPDVNKAPDAKQRFMELKTAYETLMDTGQRASYDRSRKGGFGGSGLGSDFGADFSEFGRYARCALCCTCCGVL